MSTLNIVIPARNEEEVILKTLENLKKNVKSPYKVIVVNDKSKDRTENLVRTYMKKNRNIILLNNETRKSGFGQALKLGTKKIKSGNVIYVMADLCDDPRTINKMVQKMEEGWDIVCGSRYMKGGKKKENNNKLQGFLSHIVNFSLYYFLRIPTKDTSNAFKIYRRDILNKVRFNTNSGVEASMEILGQAYFNNAKITEIPTIWTGRKFGVSKFKMVKRAPKYWKIYRWIFLNKVRKSVGMKLVEFYI